MQGDSGGFFPPQGYAPIWVALALVIFLAVVGGFIWIFYLTRKPALAGPYPLPPRKLPSARAKYLGQIDRIEAGYRAGHFDARSAHQGLSLVVRGFAQAVTGVSADKMTLAELNATGMPMVGDAVALFYPAEFGVYSAQTLDHSVFVARQVVQRWS